MAKDPTPAPLFEEMPEDLAALSDDELAAAEQAHVDAIEKIRAKDEEFLADYQGAEGAERLLQELRAGVDALKAIRGEQSGRAEAEANLDEAVEEMAAEVMSADTSDDDSDADGDGDEDEDGDEDAAAEGTEALAADAEKNDDDEDEPKAEEPEAVEEPQPEAVVASAHSRPVRRTARRHAPVTVAPGAGDGGAQLMTTMEFGGLRQNMSLSPENLVPMLDDAIVRTEGMTHRTILAQARATFPDGRYLGGDGNANGKRIRAVRDTIRGESIDALVASGGRCAPLTPRYDLPFIATDDTPVADSLARFGADRGGITFPPPIGISDVVDGITVITAEDDAAGGGSATKTCVVIDCDEFETAETAAVAGCVQHGNFGARSWPERVENISDLLRVAHAQAKETRLLTLMYQGSDQRDDAAVYGAVSSLIQGIVKAAALYRNRHRMDPRATLRLVIPAWTVDLMVADANHTAENRFVAQAEMEALLRRFGLVVTFYIDTSTDGDVMTYGADAATALDDFHATVVWYLFAPDTWLLLDGGRLDLGLVRDSVLNETNDFQVFFEEWIGLAKVGVQSLAVTSEICPSGATAAPATAITCGG